MQHAPSAPFLVVAPVSHQLPLVLSSPHSGSYYPDSLLRQCRLSAGSLRALDDGPVDQLLVHACAAGATLIAATYPRALIDLNRDPSELDPDTLADPANASGLRITVKARAGLGVVPTRLLGEPIYARRIKAAEYRRRLDEVYAPFHAELGALIEERRHRFGASLLLDCHSMPTLVNGNRAEAPIDVALGDRYGRSCHPKLVERAEHLFAQAGLRVARNRPYAGGHITEHYGRPEAGRHALQVELRRSLFIDEASHAPHDGFATMQALLADLVGLLADAMAEMARAARPAAREAGAVLRLA